MTADISAIDLFNLLRPKIGDKEPQAITDYVEKAIIRRSEQDKKELVTKMDLQEATNKLDLKIEGVKSELAKTIYIVGLVQFLAIVGSVIGIMAFMQHH